MPHTPSYSTANSNISKGFPNGTLLCYHSITFKHELKQKECDDQFKTVAAGKDITFNNPPDFINAIPFPVDCNDNDDSNANFHKNGLKKIALTLLNTTTKIILKLK